MIKSDHRLGKTYNVIGMSRPPSSLSKWTLLEKLGPGYFMALSETNETQEVYSCQLRGEAKALGLNNSALVVETYELSKEEIDALSKMEGSAVSQEQTIYEVKRDVRGSTVGESLWWNRSAAVAEAERLAQHMVERSEHHTLEQDEYSSERWNVLKPDERWPDEPRVIISYYVYSRVIHGTVDQAKPLGLNDSALVVETYELSKEEIDALTICPED